MTEQQFLRQSGSCIAKRTKNERYCDSLSQTLRVRKKEERAGRR